MHKTIQYNTICWIPWHRNKPWKIHLLTLHIHDAATGAKQHFTTKKKCPKTGASIPLREWCISPLFHISPYFRTNFRTPWKICPISPFPTKFSHFHSPKFFWWPFLVIDHKISNSPLFSLFQYISPYFAKIFFPLLFQIPPWFRKIYVFSTYFIRFSFPPYFDHDAFMRHAMLVLDAPAPRRPRGNHG